MKRLKILSAALSISCSIGVLMALIVNNNKNVLPRSAVVVPTQNPVPIRKISMEKATTRLAEEDNENLEPVDIDPLTTFSISPQPSAIEAREIGQIIANDVDDENPYPDKTVTVKSGDTLFAISRRIGVNVYKLAKINSIDAPYVIRPGQILHLKTN